MNIILSILIQIVLIGIAFLITFIYTAINEYTDRSTLDNFKPKLFKKGILKVYNTYPLENPHPIDNIELSLVIPAYNEESRLPKMMDETINFLKTKQNLKYEIIIVNDGSKDSTWTVIEDLITKRYRYIEISGVTTASNGGKGHAVKNGMKFARGKYILMLDADGATDISDFDSLFKEIERFDNKNGRVVIGSRSISREDESDSVQRDIIRKIVSFVNNFIVRNLIGLNDIKDTQCGFKLFDRKAAKKIFYNIHLARWAFDVEMLYIAKQSNMTVSEIPVRWKEIEGSKLSIVPATISFFRDYFAIITYYNTNIWKIQEY